MALTEPLKQALTFPLQQMMAAAPIGHSFKESSIFIKQTSHCCISAILGCTSVNEYKVSKAEDWDEILSAGGCKEKKSGFPFEITALEESNCLARNCLRDNRPAVLKVRLTEDIGGSPLVEYHKPCSLPRGCCCMQPEFTTKLPNGTKLNLSKVEWSCLGCYPRAKFEDPVGVDKYVLHPPLCCFNCCMQPQCGPKKCCTVPFNFYDPATGNQIEADKKYPPQIRMVRQGIAKFCCTSSSDFVVNFPSDLNAEQKTGLVGMTLLLDMTLFEWQDVH